MPKETFRRPSRGGSSGGDNTKPSANLSITATQPAREVLEEGGYIVCVTDARMTPGRQPGNICVKLDLTLPGAGEIRTRPMWVGGPNADMGDLAGDNLALITGMLVAAGVEPELARTVNDTTLAALKGKLFDVDLGVEQPRDRYGRSNIITQVFGLVEEDAAGAAEAAD
jgi:hypothetical protein